MNIVEGMVFFWKICEEFFDMIYSQNSVICNGEKKKNLDEECGFDYDVYGQKSTFEFNISHQ